MACHQYVCTPSEARNAGWAPCAATGSDPEDLVARDRALEATASQRGLVHRLVHYHGPQSFRSAPLRAAVVTLDPVFCSGRGPELIMTVSRVRVPPLLLEVSESPGVTTSGDLSFPGHPVPDGVQMCHETRSGVAIQDQGKHSFALRLTAARCIVMPRAIRSARQQIVPRLRFVVHKSTRR